MSPPVSGTLWREQHPQVDSTQKPLVIDLLQPYPELGTVVPCPKKGAPY